MIKTDLTEQHAENAYIIGKDERKTEFCQDLHLTELHRLHFPSQLVDLQVGDQTLKSQKTRALSPKGCHKKILDVSYRLG